jgi:type I restriction enzyme S subunit
MGVTAVNSEWRSFRLGDPDVATITLGQSPPSETYNDSGNGLPFFQGKADFGPRSPQVRLWCSAPLRVAEPNDILISVRAPVGDVNIADQRCSIGRGLAAIRSLRLDHEFLYYALIHAKPLLEAEGTGSTFDSINRYTLENFEITAPSDIEEQRMIARALRAMQRAAEIEARTTVTFAALKSATMAKLFREGLRGEPLKQTEIGEIPESWEVVRLGDIAKIGNGSTPKRTNEAYWEGGHIPWITSTKIHEVIISRADEFVTETAFRECHLPLVPRKSLVVAITGQGKTLGNAALLELDTCINQHLAYVQLQASSAVPEFYLFYLQSLYPYFRQVSSSGGSTKGALTCALIANLKAPSPCKEEQQEIADVLMLLTRRHKVATKRFEALTNLFGAVLPQLMTGAIRVKDLDLAEVSHA